MTAETTRTSPPSPVEETEVLMFFGTNVAQTSTESVEAALHTVLILGDALTPNSSAREIRAALDAYEAWVAASEQAANVK